MKLEKKVNLLLGFFIAALILSNMLGTKITSFDLHPVFAVPLNIIFFPIVYLLNALMHSIGGREIALNFFDNIHVSVGILTVPIMFLITDIVSEVMGRKKAREFIFIGAGTLVLVIAIVSLAVFLPAAQRSIDPQAYNLVFGSTIRIMVASIVAFLLAQLHDVWSFEFWRKKTEGKFLWFRNNLSTIISQLIDSSVFMFIAFYQAWEGADVVFIIGLIVPYWIFKILFSLLDTPLVYLGVSWMRKGENIDKLEKMRNKH